MTKRTDTATPRPLPRQPRAWQTRARLLAAGRDAFGARGHDNVNLTEHILTPAGVSVGSFYSQFADKTDLLIAVLDEAAEQRLALIFATPDPDNPGTLHDAIRSGYEHFFASLDTNAHLWHIQLRERTNPDPRINQRILAGRRRWTEQVAALLRRTTHSDEDSIHRAATMIVTLAAGLAATYLDLPKRQRNRQRPTLLADAVDFTLTGLQHLTPS